MTHEASWLIILYQPELDVNRMDALTPGPSLLHSVSFFHWVTIAPLVAGLKTAVPHGNPSTPSWDKLTHARRHSTRGWPSDGWLSGDYNQRVKCLLDVKYIVRESGGFINHTLGGAFKKLHLLKTRFPLLSLNLLNASNYVSSCSSVFLFTNVRSFSWDTSASLLNRRTFRTASIVASSSSTSRSAIRSMKILRGSYDTMSLFWKSVWSSKQGSRSWSSTKTKSG